MVGVEELRGAERRLPVHLGGDAGSGSGIQCHHISALNAEGRQYRYDRVWKSGFVEADADRVSVDAAQVAASFQRGGDDLLSPARNPNRDRVEEGFVDYLEAGTEQTCCKYRGQPTCPQCDALQPGGSVVGGVQGGHDRQQDLGGTDV